MPACWKGWNGLEEVTQVTAFWGEGIGRNSHTLELQELGGLGSTGIVDMLWIYIDFSAFLWFFIDLRGSGSRMSDILWQPVPPYATLCHPVPP